MTKQKVSGGCHCGRVKFEVKVDSHVVVHHCDCSICELTGFIHLIAPAKDFNLLSGASDLGEYQFNTGTAKHLFCKVCGVKSFYVPRSNPDGYSVNLRCLQLPDSISITEKSIDGKNWEQGAGKLSQLTKS